MTIEKAEKAMAEGLTVLKFSLDAMNDDEIKKIRKKKQIITIQTSKILQLIEIKKQIILKHF